MSAWVHAEASETIDARAEDIYAVVTDYRVGHPAILPKQYFTDLIVEEGGQGAGTILRGSVKVFGSEYPFHQAVTEPDPGRSLLETDTNTGQTTRWLFESLGDGAQTRVTIASDFPPSTGIVGVLERLTKPMVIRTIYRKELRQLADYMRERRIAAPRA